MPVVVSEKFGSFLISQLDTKRCFMDWVNTFFDFLAGVGESVGAEIATTTYCEILELLVGMAVMWVLYIKTGFVEWLIDLEWATIVGWFKLRKKT